MKLWRISARLKATGELVHVFLPAATNDAANSLALQLGIMGTGTGCSWEGTGPAYDKDRKRE